MLEYRNIKGNRVPQPNVALLNDSTKCSASSSQLVWLMDRIIIMEEMVEKSVKFAANVQITAYSNCKRKASSSVNGSRFKDCV